MNEKYEPCPFVAATDARVRPMMVVEGKAFLAKAASVEGSIRIRALNVMDHMAAMLDAAKSVKEAAKDLGLENDPDFQTNYRTACALQRACLHPDNERPAWQSPAHLMRALLRDELAMLMGHYTECERLLGIGDAQLDAEKAEGLAVYLAHEDPAVAIKHLLSNFTPSHQALLSVLMSVKVVSLIEENLSLRTELQKRHEKPSDVVQVDLSELNAMAKAAEDMMFREVPATMKAVVDLGATYARNHHDYVNRSRKLMKSTRGIWQRQSKNNVVRLLEAGMPYASYVRNRGLMEIDQAAKQVEAELYDRFDEMSIK